MASSARFNSRTLTRGSPRKPSCRCLVCFPPACELQFRRGIELNPGYATAHHWYAWHLILQGRKTEAVTEMRKAQDLDPLSLIINADLAELLLIAHSYDESIQQSRKTIDMEPNFALAHNKL